MSKMVGRFALALVFLAVLVFPTSAEAGPCKGCTPTRGCWDIGAGWGGWLVCINYQECDMGVCWTNCDVAGECPSEAKLGTTKDWWDRTRPDAGVDLRVATNGSLGSRFGARSGNPPSCSAEAPALGSGL